MLNPFGKNLPSRSRRPTLLAFCLPLVLLTVQGCVKRAEDVNPAIDEAKRVFMLSDHKQFGPKVEEEIRKLMGTEGWRWKFQLSPDEEKEGLLRTGNGAFPFMTTLSVGFAHPAAKDSYRVLTWTWIFDRHRWQMLTLRIEDYDDKQKKVTRMLRNWTVWAGESK